MLYTSANNFLILHPETRSISISIAERPTFDAMLFDEYRENSTALTKVINSRGRKREEDIVIEFSFFLPEEQPANDNANQQPATSRPTDDSDSDTAAAANRIDQYIDQCNGQPVPTEYRG